MGKKGQLDGMRERAAVERVRNVKVRFVGKLNQRCYRHDTDNLFTIDCDV